MARCLCRHPTTTVWELQGYQLNLPSVYRPSSILGTGGFGVVFAAENMFTGEQLAIKKVADAFDNVVDGKRFLREAQLMKFFKHENLVSLRQMRVVDEVQGKDDLYLFMGRMDSTLKNVIKSPLSRSLSEQHYQAILVQLFRAIRCMHSAGVLHRDVKPSNILIDSNCSVKLCDFGLARSAAHDDHDLTQYVITRLYRAPEIMLGLRDYGPPIDVWSVGVTFAQMLNNGEPLFQGADYRYMLLSMFQILGTPSGAAADFITNRRARKFVAGSRQHTPVDFALLFPHLSPHGRHLLQRLLTLDPARRITAEEALAHPYLAQAQAEIPEAPPAPPPPPPPPLSAGDAAADADASAASRFQFAWDNVPLKRAQLRELIREEAGVFVPQVTLSSAATATAAAAAAAANAAASGGVTHEAAGSRSGSASGSSGGSGSGSGSGSGRGSGSGSGSGKVQERKRTSPAPMAARTVASSRESKGDHGALLSVPSAAAAVGSGRTHGDSDATGSGSSSGSRGSKRARDGGLVSACDSGGSDAFDTLLAEVSLPGSPQSEFQPLPPPGLQQQQQQQQEHSSVLPLASARDATTLSAAPPNASSAVVAPLAPADAAVAAAASFPPLPLTVSERSGGSAASTFSSSATGAAHSTVQLLRRAAQRLVGGGGSGGSGSGSGHPRFGSKSH